MTRAKLRMLGMARTVTLVLTMFCFPETCLEICITALSKPLVNVFLTTALCLLVSRVSVAWLKVMTRECMQSPGASIIVDTRCSNGGLMKSSSYRMVSYIERAERLKFKV